MVTKKGHSLARTPLTDEQLQRLTADEFVRLKLTQHELARLRKINEGREQARIRYDAELEIDERPIVTDLRAVGWPVESVWDLVNTSVRYPELVPILLKHLVLPYSDRTREGIARALAVREARYAWTDLVAEYRKINTATSTEVSENNKELRSGAKDGLACAVAATVTEKTLDELIALIKDWSNGKSRILLLEPLRRRRFKNPKVKQLLEELVDDPDLAKEIASWRKR